MNNMQSLTSLINDNYNQMENNFDSKNRPSFIESLNHPNLNHAPSLFSMM